jgi:mannose-6-phosphate isomerase-like protein (cupin superfamily)
MPYSPDDARSQLATAAVAPAAPLVDYSGMEYAEFATLPPALETRGRRDWYARGQNLVVGVSEVDGPSAFDDRDEPEEYVLITVDAGVSAVVEAGGERLDVTGQRLVVVPPGRSSVSVNGTGRVLRLVRSTAADLAALAVNAASYSEPHHNIPAFEPWPEPVGGYRLRSYDLTVPTLPGSPFRLFRCTTMMVNWIAPQEGPRDPGRLSPHHHDDFEQYSLVLAGEYVHHIRWPWTTDRNVWRPDEHRTVGTPSLAVIPPPSEHTSEAIGTATNRLVDLFSPPRFDFSAMEGWVLNAADYPMPATATTGPDA